MSSVGTSSTAANAGRVSAPRVRRGTAPSRRNPGTRLLATARFAVLSQHHRQTKFAEPVPAWRLCCLANFGMDSPVEGGVRSEPVSEIGLFQAILDGNKLVFGAENREESKTWLAIVWRVNAYKPLK